MSRQGRYASIYTIPVCFDVTADSEEEAMEMVREALRAAAKTEDGPGIISGYYLKETADQGYEGGDSIA